MDSPVSQGVDPELDRLLRQLVEDGSISATAILVGNVDRIEHEAAAGRTRDDSSALPDGESLFDLASLTKPWMATLALILDCQGRLSLDAPVGEFWSQVCPALASCPLDRLLRHEAGFESWAPLYRLCRDVDEVADLLLGDRFLGAERGEYSDLGFILWGLTATKALDRSLADLAQDHLGPLVDADHLVIGPGDHARVVECRLDNAREVDLATTLGVDNPRVPGPPPGVPQDGNARFLGGLGAHAGLFASTRAMWALGREWLRPTGKIGPEEVEKALSGAGPYVLGWQRQDAVAGENEPLSSGSVGHIGFTGGGMWLDRGKGKILVALAHRTAITVQLDPWYYALRRWALT